MKSVEYNQVFSIYKENISTLLKVISFLTGANIATIGYAVSDLESGVYYPLFLIGGLTLFVILMANYRAVVLTLPVVIRGLQIEKDSGERGLMHAISSQMGDLRVIKKNHFDGKKVPYNPVFHSIPFGLSRLATLLVILVMMGELVFGLYGMCFPRF